MEESINKNQTQFEQASIADRLLGGIIDWLVVAGLSYLIGNLSWSLSYLLGAAYLLVRDALPFLDGQSIGKKVMKTRSVHQDTGAPLTNDYRTCFLRNILLLIPILGLVDALFIFGGERQRLGDRMGKTIVIYHR